MVFIVSDFRWILGAFCFFLSLWAALLFIQEILSYHLQTFIKEKYIFIGRKGFVLDQP